MGLLGGGGSVSFQMTTVWWSIVVLGIALLLPVTVMTVRSEGSLALGLHSVVLWHLNAAGLLIGLMRARHRPTERIESRLLNSGPALDTVNVTTGRARN